MIVAAVLAAVLILVGEVPAKDDGDGNWRPYVTGGVITAVMAGVGYLLRLVIFKRKVDADINRTRTLDAAQGWQSIANDLKVRLDELQTRMDERDRQHDQEVQEYRARHEECKEEHAETNQKVARLLVWVDYLQDILRQKKITFRPWSEFDSGSGTHRSLPPSLTPPKEDR